MTRALFCYGLAMAVGLFATTAFGQQVENKESAPAPVQIRPPKLYILSPNDVLMLKVYQEEDLQAQVRISKDGSVTLPLIGALKVGGKTIDEAAALITSMLG